MVPWRPNVAAVMFAASGFSADHAGSIAGAGAAFWIAAAIPAAGYLGWLALASRGDSSVGR